MTAIGATGAMFGKLGMVRSAATGAATLVVLYLICWLAALVGLNGSHMYVSLFTTAVVSSTAALAIGLGWSLVFGAVIGALVAFFYGLFGPRSHG